MLEKQNKDETNRKNKLIEEKKRALMIDKIIKKNIKLIPKPYRKINFTPLFISRRLNRKNQIKTTNNDNEYETLVTY